MSTIGFIGAGNMAHAIISGIYKAQLDLPMIAFDHDMQKLCDIKEKYHVVSASSCNALAQQADYIVLAIKPQNFEEVLNEIKEFVNKSAVIVSIAAGITPDYICNKLSYSAKVVQVMPNTPLLLGMGATALAKGSFVSDEEFKFVRNLFDCAGITQEIPLDKMNEIIAINGSSPAFIYQFAKCFVDYAKSVQIDETVALALFAQTLKGSAQMLVSSGKSVEELIDMVCSKGGTTIEGVHALKEKGIEDAVSAACERCTKRAYELSK